ncbi:hypothetical protein ATCVGM07011_041L [Acanthocystis turfacea Chlorella virus GM0701.1]|nr:hypothetical protein ATCVGM07011_041L [Acanthocystis turfacea Chlorella virus GM0701.1]
MNAKRALLSDRIRYVLERELDASLGENQVNIVRVRLPDYKTTIHIRGMAASILYVKVSSSGSSTDIVRKEDTTEKIIEDILNDVFRKGRSLDVVNITSKLSLIHTKECFSPREIHKFISNTIENKDYTLANITVMHDEGVVTTASSATSKAKNGPYVTDFATYVDDQEMPVVEFTKKCKTAKASIAAIKRAFSLVRPFDHTLVTTEIVDRNTLLDTSQPWLFTLNKNAEALHEELLNVVWMPENLRLTMDETDYADMTSRWISTNSN